MPAAVRVVLSDLDDTLFDHTHATRSALAEVREATPGLSHWSLDDLEATHRDLLETMHVEVLAGRVSIDDARAERFDRLMRAAGLSHARAHAVGVAQLYRRTYEQVWRPVPGALPLVQAIRQAGVKLVIVTNNVVQEQTIKLDRCGLATYVDVLVTSEGVGVAKPDPRIFEVALAEAGATRDEAVMIGDAWATDIDGAKAAGVRAVWLNRFGARRPDPAVPELRSLESTADVLRVLVSGGT
jgi:HAD superfamily hydrolase (TIGR01549 family)